jgi:hypothetical protein
MGGTAQAVLALDFADLQARRCAAAGRPLSVTTTATTISLARGASPCALPWRRSGCARRRRPCGRAARRPRCRRRPASCRRHQRGALLDRLAQRRAELRVQDRRGVFQFAGLADDRRLAVALRLARLDAQRLHALGRAGRPALRRSRSARRAGRHSGRRRDWRSRPSPARGASAGHRAVHLAADLVDLDDDLADLAGMLSCAVAPRRCRRPSHLAMARRPGRRHGHAPARRCSSPGSRPSRRLRGAPGTRTSMASKWLRT